MLTAEQLVNALLLASSGLLLGAVTLPVVVLLGARFAVGPDADKEDGSGEEGTKANGYSWRDTFGAPLLGFTGLGALVALALTLAPIRFEWTLFVLPAIVGFLLTAWFFNRGLHGGSPPATGVLVGVAVTALVVLNSSPVGYAMSQWNGIVPPSASPASVISTTPPVSTATATATATATSTPRTTLEVSTIGTSGSVTSDPPGIRCPNVCNATFPAGTAVSLVAVPGTESIFKSWGNACSGGGSCRIVLDQARTVSATFALPTLTITLAGNGSGTVAGAPKFACSPTTCTGSYPRGTQVKISASPTFGSTFTEWTGACVGTGTCGPVLDRDLVIGATFTQLTAPGYGASPCTPSAFVSLRPGETRQLVAMFNNTGSTGWSRGGGSQVNLAVCCPLNTAGPNADWNSAWLSTIAYATSTNTFVGSGSVGTFAFTVRAPAAATPGDYTFDSGLVLASTGAPLPGASCRWTVRLAP